MIRFLLSAVLLSGCATLSAAEDAERNQLDWLTGCWQSASGETREIWSKSEGGYYFGYSVVLQAETVVFFEQMRIEPGQLPVFNAYPAGAGPSAFPAVNQGDETITFANPDHDFPQKIRYWRDGNALRATISLIDDSRQGAFNYVPCPE